MTDDFTNHYGLQRLSATDLSTNSYKFSEEDRDTEDALMYLGAEGHHHTGAAQLANTPTVGPSLTVVVGSGFVPASTRVYYKVGFIDTNGIETTASPETFVDTPAGITAPNAPALTYLSTGGTLLPGPYFYALSAYQNFNSLETLVGAAQYLSIPYSTNTNKITLALPALPSGASGFNIYRKSPSGVSYRYLASVNMTVATPPTTYVDNGSVGETQSRPLPATNTTVIRNSILVSVAAATPSLPPGYSWKIYRTYNGDYTNSLLTTLTPPIYSYVDVGATTSVGQPQTRGNSVATPSKILLTGGAEVQGVLPAANGGTGVVDGLTGIQIGDLLTSGEETISRLNCVSDAVAITTSATLRLTYWTARKTETVSHLAMVTGSVGAGSGATPITPTRCQMCIFSVASNGNLTLVGITTNDTALFSTTYTRYQRSIAGATPFTKTAGQRYAFGVLVVTAGSIPTFLGMTIGGNTNFSVTGAQAPALSMSLPAQVIGIPSTIASGSLSNDARMFYGEILP